MADDKLGSWLKQKLDKAFPRKEPTAAQPAQSPQPATNQKNNINSKPMNKPVAPQKGGHFSNTRPVNRGNSTSSTTRNNTASSVTPRSNSAVASSAHRTTAPSSHGTGSVRIAALGGLNEVGKNMMFFETENDIVIIDMGFQFPEEDMLGIDYVVPDISYLIAKKQKIRAVLLTHGHLDHIGAIPYLIEQLGFPPLYGTKLTQGFVKKRLEEFGLQKSAKVQIFSPDDVLHFGSFTASFFRVNHSIPDAVGIFLQTPGGNFIHTGDFKFDFTPAGDQKPAEFAKIAGFGARNVLGLFSDSTNALKPGQTMSEKKIAKNLEEIIKKTEGRLIITAFSSLIARLQQILDYAQKYKRDVFITGRSMLDNMEIARNLGHLKYPNHIIHDISKLKNTPDHRALVLTTGSQGEDVSALTRISLKDHQHIRLKKGDTVIISATPIIGNERAVSTVINNLCKLGANVIHNKTIDVHTSGHACQEDLKLMITLVKPKYVIPVHGEYYMRVGHKDLALELGYKEENALIVENGDVMVAKNGAIHKTEEKVPTNYIMVDGLGMGGIGTQVLEDRHTMSQNGVLAIILTVKGNKLIKPPDIISRGFIYMEESEKIMNELGKCARDAFKKITDKNPKAARAEIKKYIRSVLEKKAHELLERRPLILPIIADEQHGHED